MLARIHKSMRDKDDDRGFTLIELLVVMIIIGILAAIAIPVYLNQRKKASDTSTKSDLRTVATEVESAFTDNQQYPTVTANAAGAAVAVVGTTTTNVTVSAGNEIKGELLTAAGAVTTDQTVAAGFCLTGTNKKGSNPTLGFTYNSLAGGLKTVAATGTTNACP